jgi:hypothetical protein
MPKFVTNISHDPKVNPDLWIVGLTNKDDQSGNTFFVFPSYSEEQAGIFEKEIIRLLSYLGAVETNL